MSPDLLGIETDTDPQLIANIGGAGTETNVEGAMEGYVIPSAKRPYLSLEHSSQQVLCHPGCRTLICLLVFLKTAPWWPPLPEKHLTTFTPGPAMLLS